MSGSKLNPGSYRVTADIQSNAPLTSSEFTVDGEGVLRMSDGSKWTFDTDSTLFEETGRYVQTNPEPAGENEKKVLTFHPNEDALIPGLIPGEEGDGVVIEFHVHPHAEGEKPYIHFRFGAYVGV